MTQKPPFPSSPQRDFAQAPDADRAAAAAAHPGNLETAMEVLAAEVMAGLGVPPEPPEVPLDQVAALEEINRARPLSDEELAQQALQAGGDDGDPSTPE
ncbi:MAG: hypothetical protein LBP52_07055 [Burkholderiaceae bacterium]|jgi:hypothetical protein|nr:hypothetical protein [Burkholderiaceae bacterium]